MLYVYFGTDTTQTRERARAQAHTLAGEDNNTAVRLNGDDYRAGILTERAGSVSLFGGDVLTVLDMFSENPEAFDALVADLPMLAESAHAFIVIERALVAAEKKLFQKHATTFEECTADKKERFNVFALTDAFLARDKKSLWLLFNDALRAGVSPEEAIGTLFWQVKTLRLVARTSGPEESGLKPFVYTKAKRALSKFKVGELDAMSRDLIALYHDGHLGKRDIERALEQWVLAI